MKKIYKDRLVKALRSGKYKQGRGLLCDADDKMCCLGVAYDACGVGDYWVFNKERNCWTIKHSKRIAKLFPGLETGSLPKNIRKELGLTDMQHAQLTGLNDLYKISFNQIADWIEENL